MENTQPKYEYHLLTWGGFYNEEYFKIHNIQSGDYYFDTAEERQSFIARLYSFERQLSTNGLVIKLTEGYCCRLRTVLHRVIEWDGKQYYTQYDMGVNYPMDAAQYHLEWKWYPGFNDYPLGEDFDYENNPVKIIQEWITGAFTELKA